MSSPEDPYGWSGTIQKFLTLSKDEWLISLKEHHQRCMNTPSDQSQILAWDHSFDILQHELKRCVELKSLIGENTIIFEYELPRERGRRPDVVILGQSVFVLEFKDYEKLLQAHRDQVAAYARDLKHYHAASQQCNVIPILILARGKDLIIHDGEVIVLSPDRFTDIFQYEKGPETSPRIDPEKWLSSEYSPLPSLIQAARTIWDKQPLPQIKRALSAGIPETIAKLIVIAQEAQQKNDLHLALVTGVPGAGKTLVGIQLVYENHLASFDTRNNAVFLSGNGPLVKVLQHALKNNIFVQDVHGFLKEYGGTMTKIPHEKIWVYDEAQRAWDAERVNKKRGHATSEPEDFLKLAERLNSWGLMVALIGEGQEIHIGEEAGLKQWNDALSTMKKSWAVHCSEKIAPYFVAAKTLEKNNVLDLSVTLRSHLAEDVAQWVFALLEGNLIQARMLAERITIQGFDTYITHDINVATNYVRERYHGQVDKRYGLLASSRAKNLPRWGIHNEYNYTKNMREGPWYNDSPTSFNSCCALRDVATEFSCQGLELDFPIICWGDDFVWDGLWRSPPQKRSMAKDPHRLRVNSYRVLLTRGRDGFFIFVPPEIGMETTYQALIGAGVREIDNTKALATVSIGQKEVI